MILENTITNARGTDTKPRGLRDGRWVAGTMPIAHLMFLSITSSWVGHRQSYVTKLAAAGEMQYLVSRYQNQALDVQQRRSSQPAVQFLQLIQRLCRPKQLRQRRA